MSPCSCVSVDMDALGCYAAIHGVDADHQGLVDPIWSLGMPRFLELFARTGVQATFFCVGRDLENPLHAKLAREAVAAGHEIASHSHSHLYDLRARSQDVIRAEIVCAEEAIQAAIGQRPVGFRTPGYNLGPTISRVLTERDYLYDSSIFPCPPYYGAKAILMAKMWLFGAPSRSQMTPLRTLTAPTKPYLADPGRPWRRAKEGPALWEVPMSLVPGVCFPLIGTSLHLLGAFGFSLLMPAIRRAHPKLFNLEFHGVDLLDRDDDGMPQWLQDRQPDLRVAVADKKRLFAEVFGLLGQFYRHTSLRDAVGHLVEP